VDRNASLNRKVEVGRNVYLLDSKFTYFLATNACVGIIELDFSKAFHLARHSTLADK